MISAWRIWAWATSPQLSKSAENGQTKTQNRTAALTIHREGCVFAYNTRIYGKKQLVRWKEGRGQYRRASALRGAGSEAPMLTGPTMPRFCISDSAKPSVFKGGLGVGCDRTREEIVKSVPSVLADGTDCYLTWKRSGVVKLLLEPILAFHEAGDDVADHIVAGGVDHGSGRVH